MDGCYSQGHKLCKTDEPAREQKDFNNHKSKTKNRKLQLFNASTALRSLRRLGRKKKKTIKGIKKIAGLKKFSPPPL